MSAPASSKGVEDVDVVAAGGPVQRGFGVGADEGCVDVGADEGSEGFDVVGVVAGPVGGHMQKGPGHAVGPISAEFGGGETGVVGEQPAQGGRVALADCLHDGDGDRVTGVDGGHGVLLPSRMRSSGRPAQRWQLGNIMPTVRHVLPTEKCGGAARRGLTL
jgi:hypothetical protein